MSRAATVEDLAVLPHATAGIGFRLSPHWFVNLDADGTVMPDDAMFDGGLYLSYLLNREWSFTGG